MASRIETCKFNPVNPQPCLTDALTRLVDGAPRARGGKTGARSCSRGRAPRPTRAKERAVTLATARHPPNLTQHCRLIFLVPPLRQFHQTTSETTPLPKILPDLAPPEPKPVYAVPLQALQSMARTLARPPADAPDKVWQNGVQDGLDKLGAFDPRDAVEAMFAIAVIGLNAGMVDACQLAFEATATSEQARLQRASAVALHRSVAGSVRLLDRQRSLPAAPERDWGDVTTGLGEAWRHTPARPTEVARGGTAAGGNAATIVKWIDELDDAEVQIAVEQERRANAGEPPLPRNPGEPLIMYRYKPQDYIHKFSPDPKNWRKYPGFENMTMSERREFFGYTYEGPLGPPEALSPESRDAMLREMIADEVLKEEYGM
jgi:hypothetical protein